MIPNSIDLYSDVDDIQISKGRSSMAQVVDNTGASIRWEWRAAALPTICCKPA